MINFSKNKKLNGVLNDVANEILEFDRDSEGEVLHYVNEFNRNEFSDYNLYSYGNLRIYNDEIFELFEKNGYKNITFNYINRYMNLIGYVVDFLKNHNLLIVRGE